MVGIVHFILNNFEGCGILSMLATVVILQLEWLPAAICDLTNIQWLYLYSNRLQMLPRGLAHKIRCLERLSVENNPLCAATLQDLLGTVPTWLRVLGMSTFGWASEISHVRNALELLQFYLLLKYFTCESTYSEVCRVARSCLRWKPEYSSSN